MDIWEIFLCGVGLSMDAFAASVCKGLANRRKSGPACRACGLYFGGFQAAMVILGFFLGDRFDSYIRQIDHWVAFSLLSFIGFRMLWETFHGHDACGADPALHPAAMIPLALATSIDAMAVGVSLACLEVRIWLAAAVIGVTAFLFSFLGAGLGSAFGTRFRRPAEIAGALILIALGVKIVLEALCA